MSVTLLIDPALALRVLIVAAVLGAICLSAAFLVRRAGGEPRRWRVLGLAVLGFGVMALGVAWWGGARAVRAIPHEGRPAWWLVQDLGLPEDRLGARVASAGALRVRVGEGALEAAHHRVVIEWVLGVQGDPDRVWRSAFGELFWAFVDAEIATPEDEHRFIRQAVRVRDVSIQARPRVIPEIGRIPLVLSYTTEVRVGLGGRLTFHAESATAGRINGEPAPDSGWTGRTALKTHDDPRRDIVARAAGSPVAVATWGRSNGVRVRRPLVNLPPGLHEIEIDSGFTVYASDLPASSSGRLLEPRDPHRHHAWTVTSRSRFEMLPEGGSTVRLHPIAADGDDGLSLEELRELIVVEKIRGSGHQSRTTGRASRGGGSPRLDETRERWTVSSRLAVRAREGVGVGLSHYPVVVLGETEHIDPNREAKINAAVQLATDFTGRESRSGFARFDEFAVRNSFHVWSREGERPPILSHARVVLRSDPSLAERTVHVTDVIGEPIDLGWHPVQWGIVRFSPPESTPEVLDISGSISGFIGDAADAEGSGPSGAGAGSGTGPGVPDAAETDASP